MDPRLLEHYNRELQFIRELGAEFAREFPKIAGRLGMEGMECADPYVERLLQGFSLMAAQIQRRLDDEFPRFTQHLLEMIYPQYLAPTPSMAIVQLRPDVSGVGQADGFRIPRGTVLRSQVAKGEQTPCEYRTAHDTTLWPLEIVSAEYVPTTIGLPPLGRGASQRIKAGIRLQLRTLNGAPFKSMALQRLPIYLQGEGNVPARIYEQLLGNALGIVARPAERRTTWSVELDKACLQRHGHSDEQALLPATTPALQAYRLIHEYFVLPERNLFVELSGLGPVFERHSGNALELFILLDRCDDSLENVVNASHFALFCTPAINLFPKQADRIHISRHNGELPILPDHTRPADFEVYAITSLHGIGTHSGVEMALSPLYTGPGAEPSLAPPCYYTLQRQPRLSPSSRASLSSYVGSDVCVSLVGPDEAPAVHELRQLAVQTICTNRDLPLRMPVGQYDTDFTVDAGLPIESARCVAGPTPPRAPLARGNMAWQLISQLTLHYLSLTDMQDQHGAAALREILELYTSTSESHLRKHIEGIKSIGCAPIVRRLPIAGPATFGRGLEITLTCDDTAFAEGGAFVLGAVLEQFFARYASSTSYTETVVRTTQRGEIMRWPARMGRKPVI